MEESQKNQYLPMQSQGTVLLEICPPNPWPPDRHVRPAIVRVDRTLLAIEANEASKLIVILTPPGRAPLKLETCPVKFVNNGLFRLCVAWKNREVVVYGGGCCIASNDPKTDSDTTAEIELRQELPVLPPDLPEPLATDSAWEKVED